MLYHFSESKDDIAFIEEICNEIEQDTEEEYLFKRYMTKMMLCKHYHYYQRRYEFAQKWFVMRINPTKLIPVWTAWILAHEPPRYSSVEEEVLLAMMSLLASPGSDAAPQQPLTPARSALLSWHLKQFTHRIYKTV